MPKVNRILIPELENAPPPQSTFWKREEKEAIIQYYGVKATRSIAQYLGRTTQQVASQASKMGLSFKSTQKERDALLAKLEYDP